MLLALSRACSLTPSGRSIIRTYIDVWILLYFVVACGPVHHGHDGFRDECRIASRPLLMQTFFVKSTRQAVSLMSLGLVGHWVTDRHCGTRSCGQHSCINPVRSNKNAVATYAYPPRMLAAVQSLYATGTLAMKIDGTAGQPAVQHMGVRQGCSLSPTLFGILMGCMIFCWLGLPLLACNSGPGGGSLHWCMPTTSYSFPGHLMGCST